ncbi:hypothetical protein GRI58_05690 [Porphyrobacter algicida]|uniref:Uncharacterized protein n=1 Tax=Qipengyuania algicida TaxID=1836209 RepID=A0A845ACY5_9SPHN|nr:hypothetical protein [Qipengyuania algicida]MXP28312.1 hypothetical protein [Qipengyuania algicida]
MGKALSDTAHTNAKGRHVDWRKSMSDNVAVALIVYTGLNIFLTVGAIRETGLKSLAMVCLVLLVAGIIPACRKIDRRWSDLPEDQAHDPALSPAFRRDQIVLWLAALGLPFALTLFFRSLG